MLFVFVLEFDVILSVLLLVAMALLLSLVSGWIVSRIAVKPLEKLEEVITYATHNNRGNAAPDISQLKLAHELVESLSRQIYDLASSQPVTGNAQPETATDSTPQGRNLSSPQLLDAMNIPILGIDASKKVTLANKALAEYINLPQDQIIGKLIDDVLAFEFQDDETFDNWLASARKSSVTSTKLWERVKHNVDQNSTKQFDMAASFSSGSNTGGETMVALFDKTHRYAQEEQDVSFVALAVHELRTPLTIMRGYIEVFEDELGQNLSPELTDFMHKMHASAQQLTAFVGNILNVARVEENQLALKLRQEDWPKIIKAAVDDLQLRAQVHGKHIELTVADNLPPVAVDRISIHEVVNNLVDNAIKYSGQADKIVINSEINSDGLVETNVQDFGIGVPASVMPQLFKKFHRSHKSKAQVGGTGLGLYLCKALISAHGGNIWVRSKEGEGSIFTFTVLPYDQVSKEQIAGEDGIIRGAHGWIKNHSLYRN